MADVLEAPARPAFANFVGGEWRPSRSGGTPGVVMIERPMSPVPAAARSTSRPSSDSASSGSVGTSGSRRWRFSEA